MSNEESPENREEGTDSLVDNYKDNTPGQSQPRQMTFKEFLDKQEGGDK